MLPKIKHSLNITVSRVKIYPETPTATGLISEFKLQFDGCSKGNPGIAGAGAVIYHDSEEIWNSSLFVGKKSNNYAEYSGLILGLEQAVKMNIKNLTVEGDSLLVINQMLGTYRIKSQNLLELYATAKNLEKKFDSIHFIHIYRDKNKRADTLSNIAILDYL
jgi:ribonuclease HI